MNESIINMLKADKIADKAGIGIIEAMVGTAVRRTPGDLGCWPGDRNNGSAYLQCWLDIALQRFITDDTTLSSNNILSCKTLVHVLNALEQNMLLDCEYKKTSTSDYDSAILDAVTAVVDNHVRDKERHIMSFLAEHPPPKRTCSNWHRAHSFEFSFSSSQIRVRTSGLG